LGGAEVWPPLHHNRAGVVLIPIQKKGRAPTINKAVIAARALLAARAAGALGSRAIGRPAASAADRCARSYERREREGPDFMRQRPGSVIAYAPLVTTATDRGQKPCPKPFVMAERNRPSIMLHNCNSRLASTGLLGPSSAHVRGRMGREARRWAAGGVFRELPNTAVYSPRVGLFERGRLMGST
jgi:hypothetical protein